MKKKGDASVKRKINESMRISIKEGAFASLSAGFGISYISPFALAMNASAGQIGILSALSSLVPSIAQLKASQLVKNYSRKKLVLLAVILRTLLWIPIIATGIFFYLGASDMVWVLIFFVSLFYLLGAVSYPAWFSWMGSLVPEKHRGNYFSKRNRVAAFSGLVAMIVSAFVLDGFKAVGLERDNVLFYTIAGFLVLFFLAMIMRFFTWGLLRRQYEPRLKITHKDGFNFISFVKGLRKNPFGKFAIFAGFFAFAFGIASPFWTVYMLRDLGFSYKWFMAVTVASVFAQTLFLPLLGKFSDRFGNVKLVKVCVFLISFIPFLWMASALIPNGLWLKIYLIVVPSLIGGFAWAGYNLALNNYIYDAVSKTKTSFGASYLNLLVGVGAFLGASFGSFLSTLNISFLSPMLLIFAVSGAMRLAVSLFGAGFLKEVRPVRRFTPHFLIHEFRPVQGIAREVRYIEHLVVRLEHDLAG